MYELYKAFLNKDPSRRLDFSTFLQVASRPQGYFDNNMIRVSSFLEEMSIKESFEKEQFLKQINESLESLSPEFSKYKVLPELLKALEYGGAGANTLTPILKIGGKLTQDEFNSLVLPCIINLFASTDRAIRKSLCEHLENFIEFIPEKVVNDKIFPHLVLGFSDSHVSFFFLEKKV